MTEGYIKLHRRVIDSYLWTLPDAQFKVAMTCLLMANWKENATFQGQKKKLLPGQFPTGLAHMAARSGVSIRSVRTALHNLEKSGFLTSKSTNKGRIITIVKWQLYQVDTEPTDKQTDKQPTSNRQH